MSNTKEFFLLIAQRIFSNWTALKMAVEHGMGTKEMAIDFCFYITEVMYMNEGLNSSEIAHELEDYMDQNFNTELQDDSATQVAEELLKFHRYCSEDTENLLTVELAKLPLLQPWFFTIELARRIQACRTIENDSSEDEEISDDMEVVDEWTEVRGRRNR